MPYTHGAMALPGGAPAYGYRRASAMGDMAWNAVPGLLGQIGEGFAALGDDTAALPLVNGATSPFGAGRRLRAKPFRISHPETGDDVWFRPAGRPILFSGDLSACKRVSRVARRARRARPR